MLVLMLVMLVLMLMLMLMLLLASLLGRSEPPRVKEPAERTATSVCDIRSIG
jgi:hypothetical protein